MILKRTIALALLGLLLVEQSFAQKKATGAEDASKVPKLAELHDHGDFLFADGVWRADDQKLDDTLAVVRLECYKRGGQELVGSNAYCMEAAARVLLGLPDIIVTYYPVVSWGIDRVIASDSSTAAFPICVWTQITINLHDHSIMATDTRKLEKGHKGFNNWCEQMPLAETYHLVDKVEELTRRQIRASQREEAK